MSKLNKAKKKKKIMNKKKSREVSEWLVRGNQAVYCHRQWLHVLKLLSQRKDGKENGRRLAGVGGEDQKGETEYKCISEELNRISGSA